MLRSCVCAEAGAATNRPNTNVAVNSANVYFLFIVPPYPRQSDSKSVFPIEPSWLKRKIDVSKKFCAGPLLMTLFRVRKVNGPGGNQPFVFVVRPTLY